MDIREFFKLHNYDNPVTADLLISKGIVTDDLLLDLNIDQLFEILDYNQSLFDELRIAMKVNEAFNISGVPKFVSDNPKFKIKKIEPKFLIKDNIEKYDGTIKSFFDIVIGQEDESSFDFSIFEKPLNSDEIRKLSYGEIVRTEMFKEPNKCPIEFGLMDPRIWPTSNYSCLCHKYMGKKHLGIVCDECKTEVVKDYQKINYQRCGHIELPFTVIDPRFLEGKYVSILSAILDQRQYDVREFVIRSGGVLVTEAPDDFVFKPGQIFQLNAMTFDTVVEYLIEAIPDLNDGEIADLKTKYDVNPMTMMDGVNKYGERIGFRLSYEVEDLKAFLDKMNVDEEINKSLKELNGGFIQPSREVILRTRIFYLTKFKESGHKLSDIFIDCIPVIPLNRRPVFQMVDLKDPLHYINKWYSSSINEQYIELLKRVNNYKRLISMNSPRIILYYEYTRLILELYKLFDKYTLRASINRYYKRHGYRDNWFGYGDESYDLYARESPDSNYMHVSEAFGQSFTYSNKFFTKGAPCNYGAETTVFNTDPKHFESSTWINFEMFIFRQHDDKAFIYIRNNDLVNRNGVIINEHEIIKFEIDVRSTGFMDISDDISFYGDGDDKLTGDNQLIIEVHHRDVIIKYIRKGRIGFARYEYIPWED